MKSVFLELSLFLKMSM